MRKIKLSIVLLMVCFLGLTLAAQQKTPNHGLGTGKTEIGQVLVVQLKASQHHERLDVHPVQFRLVPGKIKPQEVVSKPGPNDLLFEFLDNADHVMLKSLVTVPFERRYEYSVDGKIIESTFQKTDETDILIRVNYLPGMRMVRVLQPKTKVIITDIPIIFN